ncbi:MAG TPA: hypothetical protein PLI98_15680, partial [Candidatus Hydrogenedentes bacterium]|nr:hypothetical protein [Candidatus Hydrogenedentota bacterium]
HARMMGEYYEAWFSDPPLTEGPKREKDAYHLLEHAGMLERITGDPEALKPLLDEEEGVRHALAEAALRAVDATGWLSALPPEEEDEDALPFLEEALLFRDALNVVWDIALDLSWDAVPEETPSLQEGMQRMAQATVRLDDRFNRTDKVLLLHAMRVFDGIRSHCPVDEETEWWLVDPEPLLARHMDSAYDYVRGLFGPRQVADPGPSVLQRLREFIDQAMQSPCPTPALVAAADAASSSEVLRLKENDRVKIIISATADGVALRLSEKGRPPQWCAGGSVVISGSGDPVVLPLDRHGGVTLPSDLLHRMEQGGGTVTVNDASGSQVGTILPFPAEGDS